MRFTLSRVMCCCPQLTQKKVKVEYKTLDGTIQTIDHITKEKTAVNYRCIDMDRTVPMLMGVSKVRQALNSTRLSH